MTPDFESETRIEEEAHGRDFINQGSRFMILDNASKVLDPLLVLLCARLYAGGEWGFFKYYESILLLLLRLAAAGMDRGVVWIYARRGNDESFGRVFSRAVNFVFLFGCVLAAGAALQWAGWLPTWAGNMHKAAGASWFNILCYLASVPFQAATLLFMQALINKRQLFPQALIRNFLVPVATLGPAVGLAFTPFRPHGLAVPYLFGSILGFVVGAIFLFRAYPGAARSWAASALVPGDMVRYSLPLASTDFFMSFAYRVDILLLGRYAGLGEVEVYAVIVMISNSLRSVRQSFDGVLLSVFSKGGDRVPTRQQIRNFNYASWIVVTLLLPLWPLALLFGRELLGLIAPSYAAGHAVLSIAVFFNVWMTFGSFSDLWISGLGRTRLIPISQLTFFVASLGLNLWFIPRYGAAGAAFATGLAVLIGGGVNFGGVWYFNRGFFLLGEYWRPFLLGALMLAPAIACGLWFPIPAAWRVALFAATAILFYSHAAYHWKRFNVRLAG